MSNQAMNVSAIDVQWMKKTLQLAKQAERSDEVPVGAIIVAQDQLIACAHNLSIKNNNACAHAEMLALEQAFQAQNNYRLANATMYVSLEPCCMCAGAIIHARLEKVIFSAYDTRAGAAGSVFNILGDPRQYHHPKVIGGCLQEESQEILRVFFQRRREQSKTIS